MVETVHGFILLRSVHHHHTSSTTTTTTTTIYRHCSWSQQQGRLPLLVSLSLAKRRTAGGGGGPKRGGGAGTKASTKKNKATRNKRDKNSSPKSGGSEKAKPKKTGGAGSARPPQRAPPWQVLTKKDAKKNVQLEKQRRERIKQGLPNDDNNQQEQQASTTTTVSKAFLSHYDKNFLGWKRFNPSSVPSGMRFVASVLDKRMPPRLGVPEIAFLGRSNVGKSSLLNRLSSFSKREAGYNDEARVGKTPGATASVNLYAFYDKKERPLLGFVDLPGFGYAKLSKDIKESVQQTAEKYLGKRKELVLGILLVDIRRIPSEDDRIVLAALYDMGVPIVVVATKVDKVTKNEIDLRLEDIRQGLGLPEGQPLCVSSVTGEGTKALRNLIFEACEIGVEDFRKQFERGGESEEDDDDNDYDEGEDQEELFDDEMEESYYSQGYDWIQDSGRTHVFEYGADNTVNDEGDGFFDDDYQSEEQDIAPYRESIKDLKKKARRLERGGGV